MIVGCYGASQKKDRIADRIYPDIVVCASDNYFVLSVPRVEKAVVHDDDGDSSSVKFPQNPKKSLGDWISEEE